MSVVSIVGISLVGYALFKLFIKPKEYTILSVVSGDAYIASINQTSRINVLAKPELIKVRLYGARCPGLDQDFGLEARSFVEELLLNKVVTLRKRGKDTFGIMQYSVSIDKRDVGDLLVSNGLAFSESRISVNQWMARIKRKGVWVKLFPDRPR